MQSSPIGRETVTRPFIYTPSDFKKVKQLLYQKTGIHLVDSKRQMVYSRLSRRLRILKLDKFSDYLAVLGQQPNELQEFINALTTNLTAFFRETHHFHCLKEFAIEHFKSNKKLRVWCAAASTGEEAYSIAITLMEASNNNCQLIEILASDIDSQVLAVAKSGIYTVDRIEPLTLSQRRNYLKKGSHGNVGKVRVKQEVRSLIDFKKINLLDNRWAISGFFDIIFCRNVMIYFDKPTQLDLLERLVSYLNPHGLYFAGHSESFLHANHLVKLVGKSTYQRVLS